MQDGYIIVLLGCAMFTFVVLALVAIILAARSKLVSSGQVQILINEDPENSLTTAAGGTLLNTLSANKLFIPKGVATLRGSSMILQSPPPL